MNEMIKACTRFCATPYITCEYYHECAITMHKAIKLGIDTYPKLWKKADVKTIMEGR